MTPIPWAAVISHRLRLHSQVGQAAAAPNVLGLGDGLADLCRGALEREGALLELLLKLFALVVITEAMLRRRALAASSHIMLTRLSRNSS